MNCGHPAGTHEGHSRAGINRRMGGAGAPAVGVEGGHMARRAEPGQWEVMWPCPWNCLEFAVYLDRIIYRGCQPILKHTPAPRS